jgi:hypothetical protein
VTDHPPLAPLHAALAKLAAAGIPHALGASGLCAALGLVERVGDWDVTCDADIATLATLFAGEPATAFGNCGCHADHKLNLRGGEIELIARFAFFVEGAVVRIPTRVTRTWNGVPVGSPESWAAAYALMGELDDPAHRERRRGRAEALFGWLAANGADPEAVRALLAEPLPAALAARLAALLAAPPA